MDTAVSQILQQSKKSDWAALRKWLDQHIDQMRRQA
eukprot:gene51232-12087_t